MNEHERIALGLSVPAPSRHDMFALAEALAKESSFLIEIAKLGRRQRRGDDHAQSITEASPVHGDDGA